MKMNIKNMKTVWGAWICLGLSHIRDHNLVVEVDLTFIE